MTWQDIVKSNGLAISVVPLMDLEDAFRLDAEYYSPEFLEFDNVLAKKTLFSLGKITTKIDVGFVGSMVTEYTDDGVKLIQTQHVHEFFVDDYNCKQVNAAFHARLKKSQVHKGDILIARSGSFGSASIYLSDEEVNSADIIIVETQKKDINPFYLVAFLNSKYGKFQLYRFASGGLQGHVNLTILEKLQIAIPSVKLQEQLQNLLITAYKKNTNAKQLFNEASNTLSNTIGLHNLINGSNIAIRSLSNAIKDDRFDAEYWQPKYDEISEKIRAVSFTTLGQITTWKKGIEVGSVAYETEGVPFIRVSNLGQQEITNNNQKYISAEMYESLKEKYSPQKNEILFSKDGTAGIAHRLTSDIRGIISGGILRLTITDQNIDADYLTVCLNSLIGQMQVERYCGGSIIQHLKTSDEEKILIPVLNKAKQKEIADMAYQSRLALDEAKALIERAKHAVEVFIEQDENAALKAIKEP